MKRRHKAALALALPLGLLAAWATVAFTATSESSACTTTSTTVSGATVPGHSVGVDGAEVKTLPGVTVPDTPVTLGLCVTATSPPNSTVTVTTGGTTTTPTTSPTTTTTPPPPPGPCGTNSGTPAINKVVWIWMENHDYSQIVGSTAAPYENQLAAQCGLATSYTGITHPSLPNYIAATSGSTQGITDDNPPSSHPLSVASIFGQVSSKSYQESMPSNCALTSSGTYAVKHNPEAYYTPVRTACGTNDVPMGTTSSGAFLSDLNAGSLPAFSFVTPNLCNDMHDCSIATGDAWLQSWVPKIFSSSDYTSGHLAVVVTFDENDSSAGNHVYTAVASPYTAAGARSSTAFNHYSLLRSTEELLGAPLLGSASSANSMLSAFHLGATAPPPPGLFDDEFNGAAGTPPDPAKWYVYGGTSPPRFGVECFVNDAAHVSQDGLGNLKLTGTYNPGGVPCTNGAGLYESGGLHTGDETQVHKFAYKYGKAEARIEVPCQSGTGIWPAWWESGVAPSKPWPTDGEIDTMEIGASQPMKPQETLHGPTTSGGAWQVNNIAALTDCGSFHTYANTWTNGQIQFSIDGTVVKTYTPSSLPSGGTWPFDDSGELQQLILTLQMGANGGTIDNSTLPQSMLIDWVRVTQ